MKKKKKKKTLWISLKIFEDAYVAFASIAVGYIWAKLQTLIYTTFFTIIELTRYYKFSSGFSTDEFLCSLRVNTHTHTHTHTHTLYFV